MTVTGVLLTTAVVLFDKLTVYAPQQSSPPFTMAQACCGPTETAVAPLLIIYIREPQAVLLTCAFIVAFFPILSNMVAGLKSVDHNLLNLFELNGATRWQTLIHLRLPSSLPYFAAGLRIGGGLALIAAVVAEFAVGSAGRNSGLAFRLLESGYRLNYPRLYAALILLMLTGVAIFAATSFISWLLLHRWHESALKREN